MVPRMVLPLTGLITPLTAIAATRAFKITATPARIPKSTNSLAASPPASTAATPARMTSSAASAQREASSNVVRIGIIGGGAAGLAAARAFLRANEERDDVRFDVTALEARDSVGGIWSYDEDDPSAETRRHKSRPMYRNLRTNLPRELMAFREFAWGGDGEGSSYVTHGDVRQYLEDYANEFHLTDCIRFGCLVNNLKVLSDYDGDCRAMKAKKDDVDGEPWPKISLEWTDRTTNQSCQQTFDGVSICNGHYALPSRPPLLGLEGFPGTVIHAVEYDDPNDFAGRTVLCVGARASGGDIAREIGSVANRVYLSDSTCDRREEFGNVIRMPRTRSIGSDGEVHFSNEDGDEWTADDVDVIILCSGYDYSFPFITGGSNLELKSIPRERRVRPLYEQLWHARHPSLSFIGLPHSVVPFPLFEVQSDAVVSQWTSKAGSIPLPPPSVRMAAAERDATSGGPAPPGRVMDTHYLGSFQWDYCRKLARIGGTYDDSMENFIATNEAMYDRSQMERTGMAPGGRDLYRETRFRRLDEERSFEILYSEIDPAKVTVP